MTATTSIGRALDNALDGRIGPYGLTFDFQVMPDLSADDYQDLKADIAANGVTVPVVVDQRDRVVDGHHRLLIADELDLDTDEIPFREVHVSDPASGRDMAWRLNAHRRQLTREQKRAALERSLRVDPQLSDRQHGERVGVHHSTVGARREALESTGEISQSATRESRDGRVRPAAQLRRESMPDTNPTPVVPDASAHPVPTPAPHHVASTDFEAIRRREVLATAHHARDRIVSALRVDAVAIVAGIELGEPDLVTAALITDLRSAVALLEGQLAAEPG